MKKLLKRINPKFHFRIHPSIFGYVGTFLPLYDLTSSLPLVSKRILSIVLSLLRGREKYITDEELGSIITKPHPSETLLYRVIAHDLFDPLHFNKLFAFCCSVKYYRIAFFIEDRVDSAVLRTALFTTTRNGDEKIVKFLANHPRVEPNVDVFEFSLRKKQYDCSKIFFNTRKIEVNTCLDIASKLEAVEVLRHIFKTVKVWGQTMYREIPFKELYKKAIDRGDTKIVEFLIEYADDCKMDSEKSKGFRFACERGYNEIVELLLKNASKTRVNPAANFNEGLLIAIRFGHFKIADLLLNDQRVRDHFWDIIPDIYGFKVKSPHITQRRNCVDHVTFRTIDYAFFLACEFNVGNLIKKIVRIEAIEINILKYIQENFAKRTNKIDLLKCLLNTENVSEIGIRDSFVKACRDGRKDIVDFLRSKFSRNLDWETIQKGTEEACFHGHREILAYLIEKEGEDCVLRDGGKYLIKACRNEHFDIVRLLLKHHIVDPGFEDNQALIAAVGANRADIVEELLNEKRVNPGSRNNEAINLCTKDKNADFRIVEILLDDPRVDPTYLHNLGIVNAVRTGKWMVLTKMLKDPRVIPSRALAEAVRLKRIFFVRRLCWEDRVRDSELEKRLKLYSPQKIVEKGNINLQKRIRTNGEFRENMEMRKKFTEKMKKREKWIQNPDNLDLHQISVGKGSNFTILRVDLGLLALSQHNEEVIPDRVSHPIETKQEIFNAMIFGENDSFIKSYFRGKEELWLHYYVLFDELKLELLKRVVCAKILSVKNEEKLWEMFSFYLEAVKHYEVKESGKSIYSDLFLFTFFYYLRCSLYKDFSHFRKGRRIAKKKSFYGFSDEDGASSDEDFLQMPSYQKVRSNLEDVGWYEIFESEFLSSPFRCQRMIDVSDTLKLDEASQKIQCHCLQNYYFCTDDFKTYKDERYRRHMEKKLETCIKRNCVRPLRFVDAFKNTLAVHHGVYYSREVTLSDCSLIFTKVMRSNKNKKKRTIVQLNLTMLMLRSNYIFETIRFRGIEYFKILDSREIEIPTHVLEWKDVLCYLDFLYYGVMFEKEIVVLFRLLNFSLIFREYNLQVALLDRIERLFINGYKNESHRQLIMDIGHFFVIHQYPCRILDNLMDFWQNELGMHKKEIGSILIRSRRSHCGRRRERMRFLRSNHSLIQPIVVMDTEGVLFTTSGKGSSKKTTYWMKKVAAVKYYPESRKRETFSCLTEFPIRFRDLDRRLKYHWKQSMLIHKLTWDLEGGYPPEEVIQRTRDFVGECEVFAKGKYLEVRFLNDIGCFGVSCRHKDINNEELDYNVIELSSFGVRKYPQPFHDPLQECHYFLNEFVRRLKVKRNRLSFQRKKNMGESSRKKKVERRNEREKESFEKLNSSYSYSSSDSEDEEKNMRRRNKKRKRNYKIEEEEEEEEEEGKYNNNNNNNNNNLNSSRLRSRTPPSSQSSSPVQSDDDDDDDDDESSTTFIEPDLEEYEENDNFNKFVVPPNNTRNQVEEEEEEEEEEEDVKDDEELEELEGEIGE